MSSLEKLIKYIESVPTPNDVSFKDLKRYLESYDFKEVHVSGSHHIFKDKNGVCISIPVHGSNVKPIYVKKVASMCKNK